MYAISKLQGMSAYTWQITLWNNEKDWTPKILDLNSVKEIASYIQRFHEKQTHRNWFLRLTLCLDIECVMDEPKDLNTFRINVQVRFCTGHWQPKLHLHLQSQMILSIICWSNEFVSWWWLEFEHIPSCTYMEAHKASTEPRVETGCCLGTAFSWQTSHPFPMLIRCLHGQALCSS